MKKDKGFTLIELLAVITLIGILSIIGSISVTKLITSSKEKTYEQQVYNIEKAAKTWATNNTSVLNEDESFKTYITVEDLKLAGLLEKVEIIDPRTEKELDGCVQITYNTKNKKYKYQYTNTCNDKSNYPTIDITYLNNENKYIEVSQSNEAFDYSSAIIVEAWDSDGNIFSVDNENKQLIGPTITKNGKEVDSIIPNKVGDVYVLTYKAIIVDKNIVSIKSIKLKVVDTIPPTIKLNDEIKNDIVDSSSSIINERYDYPNLIVTDNSGEKIEIVRSGKVNTGKIGKYSLKYTATDSSKNKSTYIINVTVDQAGELTFDLSASKPDGNNNWYKRAATVTVENLSYKGLSLTIGSDVTCTYQINSNSEQNLTSNQLTVSVEGKVVVARVKCNYVDSNTSKSYLAERKISLKIDRTAPTCTTSGGSTSWKNTNVTIKGTCSDSISGCATPTVSYTTKVASGSSLNATNVGPGTNGGVATVYDNAGNGVICKANQTVKIDTIAPTCTVTATNEDGTTHNGWTNQNVTVTGTCADQGGSGCKKASISEKYSSNGSSLKYPALFKSNYTLEDNAGNSVVCGGKTVKIDKKEPYPPYICGVKGVYNISSISYSCTCKSLQFIGGGGTVEKCDGKVECKITIKRGSKNDESRWTFSLCANDAGGSGISYFGWSYGGYNWQRKTSNHTVTLKPDSGVGFICDSWGASTLLFYNTYDNAGNTIEASHYMVLSTINGNSSSSTCNAIADVVIP